jgi:hypothetical protein
VLRANIRQASETPPATKTKLNRKDNPMNFMTSLLIAALPLASLAQSQSGDASGVPSAAIPKTTGVLVIQTAKQGVTAQQIQQIVAIMPAEIRATVKLYFDVNTVDEARALMETLPLAKTNLMDHEYIPVGPLMPLRALMGPGAQQ